MKLDVYLEKIIFKSQFNNFFILKVKNIYSSDEHILRYNKNIDPLIINATYEIIGEQYNDKKYGKQIVCDNVTFKTDKNTQATLINIATFFKDYCKGKNIGEVKAEYIAKAIYTQYPELEFKDILLLLNHKQKRTEYINSYLEEKNISQYSHQISNALDDIWSNTAEQTLQYTQVYNLIDYYNNSFFMYYLGFRDEITIKTLAYFTLQLKNNKNHGQPYSKDAIIPPNRFIDTISKNPYLLCNIPQIGFLKVDKTINLLSIPYDSYYRINAACIHIIQSKTLEGHTYISEKELLNEISDLLSIQNIDHLAKIINEIIELKENGQWEYSTDKHSDWVYDEILNNNNHGIYYIKRIHRYEQIIAEFILDAKDTDSNSIAEELFHTKDKQILHSIIEKESKHIIKKSSLGIEQINAIINSIINPISIINGGPGCGKTYTIGILCAILSRYQYKQNQIILTAPTGKAAQRMRDSLQKFVNIKYTANTLHSIFKIKPFQSTKKIDIFHELDDNLLELIKLIIIDEVSMLSVDLASQVLTIINEINLYRINHNIRPITIILVGDYNQLPSIGPGNLLNNIIDEQLCQYVTLNTVYRHGENSGIAYNAKRIIEGLPIVESDNNIQYQDINLKYLLNEYHINQLTQEHVIESIKSIIKTHIEDISYENFCNEFQVLSPVHNGILGVRNINNIMSSILSSYIKKFVFDNTNTILNDNKYSFILNNLKSFSQACDISDQLYITTTNMINIIENRKYNYDISTITEPLEETINDSELELIPWMEHNNYKISFLNELIDNDIRLQIGEKLLITKNIHPLNVYNGDTAILSGIIRINSYPTKYNKNVIAIITVFNINGSISCSFALPIAMITHGSYCTKGYAITIHKSQGSEYNNVLLCIPSNCTFLINRNIIYTAITRAKKKVYIYGSNKVLETAISQKRQLRDIRKTTLIAYYKYLAKNIEYEN